MRLKTQRTVVYAVMGLTVLALVGGFVAASLSLGGSPSTSVQGAQGTTVTPVEGLSWVSTTLVVSTGTDTNGCTTAATACDALFGPWHVCASGSCYESDWMEEVNLTTIADTPFDGSAGGAPHTLAITVYVTDASGTAPTGPFYFTQASSTNSPTTITVDFDIGTAESGPSAVTAVDVVASG
jgi:hypothetical protein